MPGVTNQFVTIYPDELKFQFELEKQVFFDLKVSNTTDQHVAFKVKTTSPKKYFVRPNTGVIQPWDSCVIRVTLQAQKDYPPDMQCKDKFLLQSTKVPLQTDIDELPANTFNKDSGNDVEDCKLRVVYLFSQSDSTNAEDGLKNSDYSSMQGSGNSDDVLQRLRDEKDAAFRQTQQLQRDVERLKRQKNKKNELVFSFKTALYVALFGIVAGFLLNMRLSSGPNTIPPIDVSSSPPIPTPPIDMSSSSPPAHTSHTDASSLPPAPTPRTDASFSSPSIDESSTLPITTPHIDESTTPPTTTPPTDSTPPPSPTE